MIKPIIKFPDQILRKKCQKVEAVTKDIKKLIDDMKKTLQENQGVGLAAPQVGVLKRVIVVQTEEGSKGFINPRILKKSRDKIIDEEGCLSFPRLFLKIKRAKKVEIKALNKKGEKVRFKAEGLPARIFQHEIDHLDGILIIDRVGAGRKIWELLKFYKKRMKK